MKYGDRILPSGFFESQTWGALYKCWIGFIIAKENGNGIKQKFMDKQLQEQQEQRWQQEEELNGDSYRSINKYQQQIQLKNLEA